jgi:predicted enzyme related to lactoylglutathione lyase
VLKLRRRAIDIGIVTRNLDAMLAFYRDLLGMRLESTMDMPGGSVAPPKDAAPGGIKGATGCRYWTIHIANLDDVLAKVEAEGHKIRVARRTIREGVDVGIVEDPDGNWLELVETVGGE